MDNDDELYTGLVYDWLTWRFINLPVLNTDLMRLRLDWLGDRIVAIRYEP